VVARVRVARRTAARMGGVYFGGAMG